MRNALSGVSLRGAWAGLSWGTNPPPACAGEAGLCRLFISWIRSSEFPRAQSPRVGRDRAEGKAGDYFKTPLINSGGESRSF